MEHLPEFIVANAFLCVAFAIVLLLTLRAEFAHQANKTFDLTPLQATRLMNSENAVVIDVNEMAEFEKGHIRDAINIPFNQLSDRISDIQKYSDKAVLTFCSRGNKSLRACKVLKQSNFSNVHNIAGGLQNWTESNLPVVKK